MAISVNKLKKNRSQVTLHDLIIKLVFKEVIKGRSKRIPKIRIRVYGKFYEPGQGTKAKGESSIKKKQIVYESSNLSVGRESKNPFYPSSSNLYMKSKNRKRDFSDTHIDKLERLKENAT